MSSTTYLLFLSVTPQDEWRLDNLPEDGLNRRERELTQQFPEVWTKDNPPRLAKQVPLVTELKPGTITSAPALGPPDLAKPFTLYVTDKDKEAMGLLSQIKGHGTDQCLISRIGWTMLSLGGWNAYGQLLQLSYRSGRQPS